jgi:hypothetical protein
VNGWLNVSNVYKIIKTDNFKSVVSLSLALMTIFLDSQLFRSVEPSKALSLLQRHYGCSKRPKILWGTGITIIRMKLGRIS